MNDDDVKKYPGDDPSDLQERARVVIPPSSKAKQTTNQSGTGTGTENRPKGE